MSDTNGDEWITPAQAAVIMEVAIRTVQDLCLENKDKKEPDFVCKQWGRSWMVSAASAQNYVKPPRGRPPKKS